VDARGLQEVNFAFTRQLRDLREALMRVRLVRMAEIFERMPFVLRDLARETGKKIRLAFTGQETELDKYLVERLKDPLLHLVRNAVSHAVELPEERVAAGKSPEATITLAASTAGDWVLVEVADDGRGIDPRQVAQRAAAAGLTVPEKLDDAALVDLLCSPGFSTRDEADRTSGRGFGMSVVSDTLRELGGTLFLKTELGKGTRFTLRLPLTLIITDALILKVGSQTFAIPQALVEEITEMSPGKVQNLDRTELLSHRGGVLPLVRLARLFGYAMTPREQYPVLVLATERGRVGLVVDRVISQREVVVRAMRDPLVQVTGIAGATELGDGKPVLLLDASALARAATGNAKNSFSLEHCYTA
jgi:two-component system chemotaxis sensor kinase CheA